MSDEFGVGFAGLAMERLFDTNAWVDVSVALADRARYQNIRRQGRLQPDYLMWQDPMSLDSSSAPYYVVECKGSQSQLRVSIDQIRRGLEQVPTLRFGRQGRQVRRLVVASLLQATNTTVFVIDPEDDETPEEHQKRIIAERSRKTSEKLSQNVYFIPDPERFEEKTADARSAQLLNWAGHYRSAAAVEKRIEIAPFPRDILEDQPIAARDVGDFRFDGFRVPLFPELGVPTLNVFVGVEHDILETVKRDQANVREAVSDRRRGLVGLKKPMTPDEFRLAPRARFWQLRDLTRKHFK